jgi:N-acetyl sugar amidotransferase
VEKMKYCKNCLMPSTRPRITYTEEGICNGCAWAKKKKTAIDWEARWTELKQLCDKYRSIDGGNWDVIVPCSGGKDSYHIAWCLKYKLNMHPLLVKVAPHIPTKVGEENMRNLADQGFDIIEMTPNMKTYCAMTKKAFFEQGRPQHTFEVAITTAILKISLAFKIPFIMYGEEGESEYAGKMDMAEKADCKRQWILDTYFSGLGPETYAGEFSKGEMKWLQFPSQEELDNANIFYTHWSYFEDWNHLKHFETAKKAGFKTVRAFDIEEGVAGFGTYTDYTSLDDPYMRTFNTYLMFLKFGYGRGSHEASSDIKVGIMTREEGIEMAKRYDSYDCYHFRDKLLKRFEMTQQEWDQMVDKWANQDILKKENGRWVLKEPLQ